MHVCTLEYTERALDAARRYQAGQRQVYCPVCRLWRWPDACPHEGRLSGAQFRALAGRAKGSAEAFWALLTP